jgi:transposase
MPVPRKKRTPEAVPAPASTDDVTKLKAKRPQDWTALERAEVVLKASRLAPQELGEFLRSQGLHRETLDEWTTALEETLSAQAPRSSRALSDAKRIRELERDLARKDRALAETAALLILKKKMALFWGDDDEDEANDTGSRSDE